MKVVEVFDPAMCCSTGVCGSEVDPALVTFAADLDWLEAQGAKVERINLARQPQRFAQNEAVRQLLEAKGESALPAVIVNGEVKQSGGYPSREQLAEWAGLPAEISLFTDEVAELVALGAAVASNCEPCFRFHYDQARKLGVTVADMRRAVELAQRVKDAPARNVLDVADRYLNKQKAMPNGRATDLRGVPSQGGCCGPVSGEIAASSTKCC